jgi:hypothetical protein
MHISRIGPMAATSIVLALGLGAGCGSSSSGGNGTTTDGGDDSTGGSSGGSSSSGASSSSSSSGASSSSSSSSGGSASSSSGSSGSSGGTEAGSEGGSSSGVSEAGADGGCSGATPVALTVKNYETWCTLTANGSPVATGSPGTTASSTLCVALGTVNLVASPLSTSFELGPTPWHDTSGDHGSGDPGTQANLDAGVASTSSTTVAASGTSACVWACCPFTSGSGCSGITNQCP